MMAKEFLPVPVVHKWVVSGKSGRHLKKNIPGQIADITKNLLLLNALYGAYRMGCIPVLVEYLLSLLHKFIIWCYPSNQVQFCSD